MFDTRSTKRTVLSALLGGFLHSLLAGACWLQFGFTTRLAGNELLVLYLAIGAVAVGAVPSALFDAHRLAGPLLVVVAIFLVTAIDTWLTYVVPTPSPTPVGPTAFGWYLLGWWLVLGCALLAGVLERGLRDRRRGDVPSS